MIEEDLPKLSFVDLFAGCGGLSEGFMSAGGYDGFAHVEWERPMVDTLRSRLSEKWGHSDEAARNRVIHFDIQYTDELVSGSWSAELVRQYGETNASLLSEQGMDAIVDGRQVDVIIGGPPCQAYSIAGRAQDSCSMKNDYRNYLFESFVKVVGHYKPRAFVFENVPGMLSAAPGDTKVTKRIFDAFAEIGYDIPGPSDLSSCVMDSSEFGVPQKRRRVIVIGTPSGARVSFGEIYKEIDNAKSGAQRTTVLDAIAHLPKYVPLKKSKRVGGVNISHALVEGNAPAHHLPRFTNLRDIQIFIDWVKGGMNNMTFKEKAAYYFAKTGKNSNHVKYRSLDWNAPSPTIVAHLYKDGLMFIHPDYNQARSITVKEAALLQSFPDDFSFVGSQGSCYKMIGNAVPPLMAEGIAKGLRAALNN